MGIIEGFIPVLIAIAYLIFQGYTGYKKEKEKAAKRQYGKPAPKQQEPQRSEAKQRPQHKPLQPPIPPVERPVSNPSPEPVYTDYTEQPSTYEPKTTEVPPSLLDEYQKMSDYAEIEKLKAEKREALKSNSGRETIRPKLEQLETEELDDVNFRDYEIEFDVREAILAKAILDRPYS